MTRSNLILASRSPRRYELLQKIIPAERILVIAGSIDESILPAEDGVNYTKRIAFAKAADIMANMNVSEHNHKDVILGADTIIDLDHELIGKPYDGRSAFNMLMKLRSRWHSVITSVCLVRIRDNDKRILTVSSDVFMKDYSEIEVADYIKTGEPLDKAGAYAIQGKGKELIKEFRGSYSNIVGLPIEEVAAAVRSMDCAEMLL